MNGILQIDRTIKSIIEVEVDAVIDREAPACGVRAPACISVGIGVVLVSVVVVAVAVVIDNALAASLVIAITIAITIPITIAITIISTMIMTNTLIVFTPDTADSILPAAPHGYRHAQFLHHLFHHPITASKNTHRCFPVQLRPLQIDDRQLPRPWFAVPPEGPQGQEIRGMHTQTRSYDNAEIRLFELRVRFIKLLLRQIGGPIDRRVSELPLALRLRASITSVLTPHPAHIHIAYVLVPAFFILAFLNKDVPMQLGQLPAWNARLQVQPVHVLAGNEPTTHTHTYTHTTHTQRKIR